LGRELLGRKERGVIDGEFGMLDFADVLVFLNSPRPLCDGCILGDGTRT
jgi:hypothetical protein